MTTSTQIIKSVVPAIAALVYRAKEAQNYMEPQTCAIASLAMFNMLTMLTRDDVVPAVSMVELATNAIDRANKYNNDMKDYHYTDTPVHLIGLAKHFGFITMSEDKTFSITESWIELITTKDTARPMNEIPTAETRRKPYVKGGKVKPSKLAKEAMSFLESTAYHVDRDMAQIVSALVEQCKRSGRPLPVEIQQEIHVWNACQEVFQQDELFSEYFADARFRLYHVACAGPNPQSSDFARSMYSLNVSVPVAKHDESGSLSAAYIMFMNELADISGGEWISSDRLTFVSQNPVKALSRMLAMEEGAPAKPFTYIRLALDWFKFETTGECDSRVGFGLDAKCSGTQYLAFIAGNLEMARATGLVDSSEKAPDPYQLSLRELMKLLPKTSLSITAENLAEHLNPKTGRAFIKTPYMAIQYGGSVKALMGSSKFCNYAMNKLGLAEEQLELFAETCVEAIKNALGEKINKFIAEAANAANKKCEELGKAYITYRHTDGALVHKPCFPSREICDAFSIRVDSAIRVIFGQQQENKPWTIRSSQPTADEFARTFVVNFVQGIDALVARTVAVHAKRAGLRGFTSIHDCFRCTLADAPRMMSVIRSAYIEVFVKNNQFENLSKQLGGIDMYQTNIVTEELLNSEYSYYFCQ